MPMNPIHHYNEADAERRRKLIRYLADEKQQYMAKCQPYIDELVEIDNRTPVSYVVSGDDLNVIGIMNGRIDQ